MTIATGRADSSRRRRRRWWPFGIALAGAVACWTDAVEAATSCSFTAVAGVSFGAYSVFATSPNSNGVGSLTIKCQGGGPSSFTVTLSTGQSLSYAARVMKSGGNALNYNLYTSSGRTVVWGDGSGGSSTRSVARNSTTTLSVFGQMPAGQDAAVGIYGDAIVATVNF